MTTELKPCPCGHVPEGLRIEGEVKAKFARVSGECCGEWSVEFRNDYCPLDSEQSWDRAAQAWNSAPRQEPRVEREPVATVCLVTDKYAHGNIIEAQLQIDKGANFPVGTKLYAAPPIEREPSDEECCKITRMYVEIMPKWSDPMVGCGRAMFQAVRKVMGGEVAK